MMLVHARVSRLSYPASELMACRNGSKKPNREPLSAIW